MIKKIKYCFLFVIILFLSSCGTREYLGFEKKKIRLKGERVSILKETPANDPTEKKSLQILFLKMLLFYQIGHKVITRHLICLLIIFQIQN